MNPNTLFQYPFTPKTITVNTGQTLSYLDEGTGPPLVMIHGNPSWSYLYRNLVTQFKSKYRCIVPDHLGCGLSEKPQNYPYSLHNHIDNLSTLLNQLNIRKCVLIVHDWGGAIGMGWAGQHPDRIAGMVVLNTAAFPSTHLPFRIAVCRVPLLGALLVRGFNGFARAAIYMAVKTKMKPEVAAGFLHPYNSWKNRIAVHRFVQDIPMNENHPSWETLTKVESSLQKLQDKPMLICWGGKDFCFNDFFYKQWQKRFPQAQCCYFPKASHYVLEDAGQEICNKLSPFLQSCHG